MTDKSKFEKANEELMNVDPWSPASSMIWTTGETIEEARHKNPTIGMLRDHIIEMAVKVAERPSLSNDSSGLQDLKDAVDTYHTALRERAREGRK